MSIHSPGRALRPLARPLRHIYIDCEQNDACQCIIVASDVRDEVCVLVELFEFIWWRREGIWYSVSCVSG